MAKQLKTLLDGVKDLYKQPIIPVKNNIYFHKQIQLGLFGLRKKSHVKMGVFYELLTVGLFGGDLTDTFQITNKVSDNKFGIQPDVLDIKKGNIYESKAFCSGHQLNILDDQIKRYIEYQSIFPF